MPALGPPRSRAGPLWASLRALPQDGLRLLRLGLRTGLLAQPRLPHVARLTPQLAHQPLGAGLIPAIWATLAPDRTALETPTETLSYADLDAMVNQLVRALRAAGLAPGQRVAIVSPNSAAYLITLFAAFRGGWGVVHGSYRLTGEELHYLLEDSRAQAVLFAPECWPALAAAGSRLSHAPAVQIPFGPVPDAPDLRPLADWVRGHDRSPARPERRLRALPNLVYTSGTTGRPKGAVRDFARIGPREMARILARLPIAEGERHLVACPLYHSAAQAFCLLYAAAGATLIPWAHFDAEAALRALHTRAVDSAFLVPTQIRLLLDLPASLWRRYPPRLRALVSGAAPFPHALRLEAIARFGPVVHDFYGSTEAGWVTLVGSEEMLARPGTVGRPIPGTEVRILDDAGAPLPPGTPGQIAVRSPQRMVGYLGNRAATRERLRGEFLLTGDLGYLDEAGYLFLSGRASDLIISGGVNVYPAEVEQVLLAHPRVRDAAVVGVAHPTWGEQVAAFLVGPTEADLPEIERHCREALAGFKVPRSWFLRDGLPHNATGKVLRRALRREVQHAPEASEAAPPRARRSP